MNPVIFRVVPACIALVAANLVPAQASAHHSFAAEFDINQPFEVTGAVTLVEWTAPHGRLYVDVEDEDGEIVNYNFELTSPPVLMRQGWSKNDLQPGDRVVVSGHRARKRPTVARAVRISRENGETVYAGVAGSDD
jgi:hypothetical protein